jgi:hypothetical protein
MPDVVSHDNHGNNRWYGVGNNWRRAAGRLTPPFRSHIPDYSSVSICNFADLAGLRLGTYIIRFPNFGTLAPGVESSWIRTV